MEKQTDKPKTRLEEHEYTELVLTDKIIPKEFGVLCSPMEWAFELIKVGATVEFKIIGVDERYLKLYGVLKTVEPDKAVFENLSGLIYVKAKFAEGIPIIAEYGNRIYVSTVIQLKNQLLVLQNPPRRVIARGDKRKNKRYPCGISVQYQVEQRGVVGEKSAVIKNLCLSGCCLAVERTKDAASTGISVGKEITILLDLKRSNLKILIPGTIRNVRKDNTNEGVRLAGIEFKSLSEEAFQTIDAIVKRLTPVM